MAVSTPESHVQSYILYSALLAVKVLAMAPLTARWRYQKGVFANPEDAGRKSNVILNDPDVEQVRRAHLNDLENIPVFWILGALYVTIGPDVGLAIMLFRVYTVCRVLDTIVYAVKPLPQPSRAIVYAIPILIKCYMAYNVIGHYIKAF